jgi:peptidoglycan glycosyltransferase
MPLEKNSKTPLFFGAIASFAIACFLIIPRELSRRLATEKAITEETIAAALDSPLNANRFPGEIELSRGNRTYWAKVKYTLDHRLQAEMEKKFETYQPDYGAFVAIDATTGRILSLISYTKNPSNLGNLTLKATFPSASVFKIVTATAAIDQNKANIDTVFHFSGANHTLYKRNVASLGSRHMTLKEAFAKSVNTVFGKLGVTLHSNQLEDYARRFKFNEVIASDIPIQAGRFKLADQNSWTIAEIASGYNRVSVMSPVQGALMAASIANDGIMMEPHLVDSLVSETGAPLYQSHTRTVSITMKPETAAELRHLMHETVAHGTSQKAFRPMLRKKSFSEFEIGGKTGSLTSLTPRGRCEWFVGYAVDGNHRIAVAALTVHEKIWKIKPSEMARFFIERYFKTSVLAAD